ncbi:hypothetical protein HDK90DRAFT_53353 [Phyllosticta capitalensis]|uniref:Uncharacterized protein n=1 Tax=Phyllosticta capitalensis TaxID=121624 RepID=A0ABR1YES5_9PEZI
MLPFIRLPKSGLGHFNLAWPSPAAVTTSAVAAERFPASQSLGLLLLLLLRNSMMSFDGFPLQPAQLTRSRRRRAPRRDENSSERKKTTFWTGRSSLARRSSLRRVPRSLQEVNSPMTTSPLVLSVSQHHRQQRAVWLQNQARCSLATISIHSTKARFRLRQHSPPPPPKNPRIQETKHLETHLVCMRSPLTGPDCGRAPVGVPKDSGRWFGRLANQPATTRV